jgi:dihydrofolate reductase
MRVALIWAMTKNRTIGRDNALPWKLPDEMRHFVRTTRGKPVKPVVMGRKQFESMGKPLPGRANIVLTRDTTWYMPGVDVVRSLDEALALGRRLARKAGVEEVMVIGGAEIKALALPVADRLYMTLIDAELEGDVHFPPFDEALWREVSREHHAADARHAYPYSIRVLDRVK